MLCKYQTALEFSLFNSNQEISGLLEPTSPLLSNSFLYSRCTKKKHITQKIIINKMNKERGVGGIYFIFI